MSNNREQERKCMIERTKTALKSSILESNSPGVQLLYKMGYKGPGAGLGKHGQGITEPIDVSKQLDNVMKWKRAQIGGDDQSINTKKKRKAIDEVEEVKKLETVVDNELTDYRSFMRERFQSSRVKRKRRHTDTESDDDDDEEQPEKKQKLSEDTDPTDQTESFTAEDQKEENTGYSSSSSYGCDFDDL